MMRSRFRILGVLCFLGLVVLIAGCGSTSPKDISGSISGTVINLQTSLPLSSGSITVDGSSISSTIGANGEYQLNNIPAGDHTLSITSTGVSCQVNISIGASQKLNNYILQVVNGTYRMIENFEGWDGSAGRFTASPKNQTEAGNIALNTTDVKIGSKAAEVTFPAWSGWSVINSYTGIVGNIDQINPTHIGFWVKLETPQPTVSNPVAFQFRFVNKADTRWYATLPDAATKTQGWQFVMIPVSAFNTDQYGSTGAVLTPSDISTLNGYSLVAKYPNTQEVKFLIDEIMAIQLSN